MGGFMNCLFFVLLIFVVIIGILNVLYFYYYNKIHGYVGEILVRIKLSMLPKKKYTVLNDVMIEANGSTHQIDHIVISKYGIFVIETKNYFGLIVGDEYKDKWIQFLGKNKYYFHNPIHQNYGHILALKEVLRIDEKFFISIVCMSNKARLKINSKTEVVQLFYLNKAIKSYKEEKLNIDLSKTKEKLEDVNIKYRKKQKEHINNIKNTLNEIKKKKENMICPRCGGSLVEKVGKYGKFLGCSNYPKCKYIKSKN